MDNFLFDNFIIPLEDSTLKDFYKMILSEAQTKVKYGEKEYYNYYPQEKKNIQIILETTEKDNKLKVDNMFFHHTSGTVWRLKIIEVMNNFANTYLVSKEDDTGVIIIRLVNEAVLGKKLKTGDIIEAQVSAFGMNIDVYKNEKSQNDSIFVSENMNKIIFEDGVLMPSNLIINNNTIMNEKERNEKEHHKDNLLKFKGTIKYANKYDINMFGIELPKYYSVVINTGYGELPIFFTKSFLNNKMIEEIEEGNTISGDIFLSGDVCINEYEKYAEDNR